MAAIRIHKNPLHTPQPKQLQQPTTTPKINIQHFCAPVIHSVTGEHITDYTKLKSNPLLKEQWGIVFGAEFGRLAQGDYETCEKGAYIIFVMTHEEIANVHRIKVITCARVVPDYRP